jgi:hypothetical protein
MEQITLQNLKSLIPPIYYELSKVKEGSGSYRYYQTRHPAGLFSMNFTDVLTTYNELASLVNNQQVQYSLESNEDHTKLKELTVIFLFRLITYFESGYEIFLNFCPETDKPKIGQPLYKWFSNQPYKQEVEKYFSVINPTIKKYRDFFNGLKHSSNQIAIYYFFKNDSPRLLGFYLEGVNPEGAISAVPELHQMYKDQHTEWSYNFHLRIFYFLIYKIAIEIEKVVGKLCEINKISLTLLPCPLVPANLETPCERAYTFARQFKSMFGLFYPQESIEITKDVKISVDNSNLEFLDYTPNQDVAKREMGYIGAFRSRGDSFSRSWTLPYMGGPNSK